jgi:hypothetical protein
LRVIVSVVKECYTRLPRGAAMPEYRLYCLDGANRITRAEQVVATSDEQAIEAARSMKLPVKCELWQRDRLVARIAASGSQS